MNWEFLRDTGKRKHINPFGVVTLYDVVLQRGRETLKCRGAVAKFGELKRPWHVMNGYSSFAKGVRLYARPDAEMRMDELGEREALEE